MLQVRADLNVPLSKTGTVEDDTRIKEAIPTLKYLLDNDAQVLLCSHLVSDAMPCHAVPLDSVSCGEAKDNTLIHLPC
jgi:3-phosphoglycerate kinase